MVDIFVVNFFKNIIKILSILSKSKFNFSKPSHKKYLIFDKTNSLVLQKYLKKKFIVLHTRNEEINLYILALNFLNRKFSKQEYFQSFIDVVRPDIIITAIDNNPSFYLLKKNNYQKKILIQQGYKFPTDDQSILTEDKGEVKVIKNKNYNVDIAFVFNQHIGKFFKQLNVNKIIISGSLNSNFIKILKKKKIDLLLISSFVAKDPKMKYVKNFTYKKYFFVMRKVLEKLAIYVKKHKLNFYVLGKHRSMKNEEFIFYNKIFKNIKWNYLPGKKYNSYKIVDMSRINITFRSTLGYESLSRGNKTIFLDPYSNKIKNINFGWPCNDFKKNGPFWTTKLNYKNLEKIINKFNKMKQSQFVNLYKQHFKKLIYYDKYNSKLKSFLN